MMENPMLIIGNRNYSSWSLRAWLVLRKAGIDFELKRLPLDTTAFRQQIGQFSPTGKVPVLRHGERVIWESLAIAEYINEVMVGGRLWPATPGARAHARSVSAEMHAGFSTLRSQLPMNCRARDRQVPMSPELTRDIERVQAIWRTCLARFSDGGWLYGEFSIADAMYAPVAFRFQTYQVELDAASARYVQKVLADPAVQMWCAAAEHEPEVLEAEEVGRRAEAASQAGD